jgi:hypothetical protein
MSETQLPDARSRVRLSVRYKIMLLVAAVVVMITGLDAYFVPERAADAEREGLRQRSHATAAMLAAAVKVYVEFDQPDVAQEALDTSLADGLVLWAAIYRRDGSRIAAVSRGTAGSGAPRRFDEPAQTSSVGSRTIVGSAPIQGSAGTLGTVAVGLRTASSRSSA